MLSNWILISLATLTAATTPTESADWQGDYGKALEQTRQDDQPLLVVLDNPADESQRLDPELLSPESGAFPLASYDLCHIDVSTEYGKQVAEVFNVSSFPHAAIIDKSGSVILKRLSGDISEATWKATLAKHEEGLRPSARRYTVAKPVVDGSATVEPSSSTYTIPAAARPYCPSCQLNR